MKATSFRWAYNSELNLRYDPKMSRDYLAKLVRHWRKNGFHVTRRKTKDKTLFIVQTGGLFAFSEVSK